MALGLSIKQRLRVQHVVTTSPHSFDLEEVECGEFETETPISRVTVLLR